jgi:hypothetical protein
MKPSEKKKILESVSDIIFPSETNVEKFMRENNITKLRLYKTMYVDANGYSTTGYTVNNIDTDIYFRDGVFSTKTQLFLI